MIADKLAKEQISQILEAFSRFDKDGDGIISKDELETAMENLGENPTQVTVIHTATIPEASSRF